MKKIQPPKLLSDLISDMRDRRLLLPALLLVIALVAVPVALSTSPATPAPQPAAAVAGGGKATAAEPAVLTAQVGIRSYRKRLAHLKQKNPFQRHFALPKTHTSNPGVLAPPTPSADAASASASSAATSGSAATASGTDTVSATTSTTQPATSTTTRTVTVREPHQTHEVRLYSWVADVKVGPKGSLERHDGVKNLEYLPKANTPILIFAGAKVNGEQASFLVSNDVSSVDGGVCRPGRNQCQVLRMKPGDKASLDYAPDGKTYVLKLIHLRQVRVGKSAGDAPVAAR